MPPPVAEDDHKRRARRRLIGAVALTVAAVIILPLVLEDKPPPPGSLELRMPPQATSGQGPADNAVEFAPPPENSVVTPSPIENVEPAPVVVRQEPRSKSAEPAKTAPVSAKSVEQEKKKATPLENSPAYTVQVGVFADKENVLKLQARISALGLNSRTDEVEGGTRVRVGSYLDKAEADTVSAKLMAGGIKGQVVEK